MKADEIRQQREASEAFWLREIAAQLAELNANLRKLDPIIMHPDSVTAADSGHTSSS